MTSYTTSLPTFLSPHCSTLIGRRVLSAGDSSSQPDSRSREQGSSLSGSRTKREGRGGVGGSSAAAYFSRWRLSVCPCVGRERDEDGGAAEAGVLMRVWRSYAWTGVVIDCAMTQIGPVLQIHRYSKFKPYNKEMRAREELALGHFM